ncbi:MAG: MFS transporter [Halopseudomonas sp.]
MNKHTDGLTGFINRRLFLATLLSTILASVISATYTLTEFNVALKPQLQKKVEAVAEVVRDDLLLAVNAGVPFDQIRGMELYLKETVEKYPELVYVAVTDLGGRPLYLGGDVTPAQLSNEQQQQAISGSETLEASFTERIVQGGRDLLRLLPLSTQAEDKAENLYLVLANQGQSLGAVQVGLDTGFIHTQLTDIFFDIAIVLIAVLLVAFEVVMVLVMYYVSGPLKRSEHLLKQQADGNFSVNQNLTGKGSMGRFIHQLNDDSQELQTRYRQVLDQVTHGQGSAIKSSEDVDTLVPSGINGRLRKLASQFNLLNVFRERQGNILDARIPLFVFAFAEELQKSFMPLFVGEFYEPSLGLDRDLVAGLPISVFMLVIAVATPFAGAWVDRWGNKRLFLWGLVPALAGYLGCGLASSVYEIIFWRGMTAFGYAIITISCQGYIAAISSSENRAKSMATFIGVLMTATMCGTALGGIIADRIGYQPVFLISAVLATFAGVLAWMMLADHVDDDQKPTNLKGKSGLYALAGNLRFVCIVLFCAIPAKIILTGFLYFLVPVYLVSMDASQSEIGRVMMVYSLIIIFLGPLASKFADRSGQMLGLVVVGTILSGIILVSLYGQPSVLSLLLAVAMMGAAHAILKAPLIAAAMEAAEATPEVGRTTALGVLRTSERIGSVLGPLLVATLLLVYDYGQAMVFVGAGTIIAGITMGIYLKGSSNKVVLAS